MRDPLIKELNWFIFDLIKIRNDLKRTPNYTADIEYNCKDILKQKILFKIEDKTRAINKIQEMLSYIKNDIVFLSSLNIDEKYLSFFVKEDDMVVIKGYQMEILTGYLDKINEVKKEEQDPVNKNRYIYKDKNEDYFLNGIDGPRLLKLRKGSLYYSAFDALYSLAPDGGVVTFNDFIGRVKMNIKRKLIGKEDKVKCAIIHSYLTDKQNGFLRASKIEDSTFKDKPLIKCNSRIGITFNNIK